MQGRWLRYLLLFVALASIPLSAVAKDAITIAAAADLKFAMDDLLTAFRQSHPGDTVQVVYGSSGKFTTQIEQGAPFDLFFAADIAYPQTLFKAGLTAGAPTSYAIGRIVLWSATMDASRLALKDLAGPEFDRIAIANPEHAPYGKRAVQALHASGMWDKVQSHLVYGEDIAQTAQFVQTGNARVGIIALSLAMNPALASKGGYALIPATLYQPLVQGFVITRRAAANPLAGAFARFVESTQARTILQRYGFAAAPAAAGH